MSSESVISHLLRERYAAPEWAYLVQVSNGTGWVRSTKRWADALALNLWPSRGLELLGFEIKVSRSDWLKELKDPAKSSDIQGFCDRWWLVAGDDSIVRVGELPSTWGLMVVKNNKLKVVVEAPKLESKAVDRPMLCSILRCVSDQSDAEKYYKNQVNQLRHKLRTEIEKEKEKLVNTELKYAHDRLVEQIRNFEDVTGLKFNEVCSRFAHNHTRDLQHALRFVIENKLHNEVETKKMLESYTDRVRHLHGQVSQLELQLRNSLYNVQDEMLRIRHDGST